MTEGTAPRKFMFDQSFDAAALRAGEAADPSKPKYTQAQFDDVQRQAYEQGLSEGRAAATAEHTAGLKVIVDQLGAQMLDLLASTQVTHQRQDEQTMALALAIAGRLLPGFVERHGLDEIRDLVAHVLAEMSHEPRLVIRVADSRLDALNAEITRLTEQSAFAGKIILLADPQMQESDCRIEWADGGVERSAARVWQDIGQLAPQGEAAGQVSSSSTATTSSQTTV